MDLPLTEQVFRAMFHKGPKVTVCDEDVCPVARQLNSDGKMVAVVHCIFECAGVINEKKIRHCSDLFADVQEEKIPDLLMMHPRLFIRTLASRLQLAGCSRIISRAGPFICVMCINAIHLEHANKHRFWSVSRRTTIINLGAVCATCRMKTIAEVSTRAQIVILLGAFDIPQDIGGLITLYLARL